MLEPYLLFFSLKFTNLEHTIQYKLQKDPDSNRVNDLLLNRLRYMPISLHSTL